MQSYVKFMKEILSLTKECSAIIEKKIPPKLKDLRNFNIPCTIGNVVFEKALCDLRASVNLMPLSVYQKLKLGEEKPTTVTLHMVGRLVKHPRGVIEDVLVKVDKFIFPANFIILDMEEDANIPIILGRTFLATGRALIDVRKGELKLRVQKGEVTFNVFVATEIPTCCRLDVVKRRDNELEVSKQGSMTKCGMQKVRHRLKRFFSWKIRMLHE
ncbi:uncharacterized protein LOC133832756 [Humulus lupulus]|uniref:uncharacterized protein LOC133832756 n=1 Tax=Humulus lupulus TaxID=3486 RepID=UPI002B407145|nr:uncharacterized protein LOC133832756 [Humulus lupulus]